MRRLLGGSWVVISGAISPLIWVITIVILLITSLITTHEPPSRVSGLGVWEPRLPRALWRSLLRSNVFQGPLRLSSANPETVASCPEQEQ